MSKVKFLIAAIWQGVLSFISPVCIGLIYMDITGHSKGYSYDLGLERDISIMSGCVELLLWIAATVPSMIWLSKKLYQKKKIFAMIPITCFFLLFGIGILYFGWDEFLSCFGI